MCHSSWMSLDGMGSNTNLFFPTYEEASINSSTAEPGVTRYTTLRFACMGSVVTGGWISAFVLLIFGMVAKRHMCCITLITLTKFLIFVGVLAGHILAFVCGDQRWYCSVMRGVNRFVRFLYSEALDDPRTDELDGIIRRVEAVVM